jgi:hypothetical protein
LRRKAGLRGPAFFMDPEAAGFARIGFMADIIEFPRGELTRRERERLKEFMRKELADIQDTSCTSVDEIRDQIRVFFGYVKRFTAVFENPATRVNPDYDFALYLMEVRIRKIRGMIKYLFGDEPEK